MKKYSLEKNVGECDIVWGKVKHLAIIPKKVQKQHCTSPKSTVATEKHGGGSSILLWSRFSSVQIVAFAKWKEFWVDRNANCEFCHKTWAEDEEEFHLSAQWWPKAYIQINRRKLEKNEWFQQKKIKSFRTAQPEPSSESNWKSVGWSEEGWAQKMPSQSDRFLDCQVKMCHDDRPLPKKGLSVIIKSTCMQPG